MNALHPQDAYCLDCAAVTLHNPVRGEMLLICDVCDCPMHPCNADCGGWCRIVDMFCSPACKAMDLHPIPAGYTFITPPVLVNWDTAPEARFDALCDAWQPSEPPVLCVAMSAALVAEPLWWQLDEEG